MNQPIVIRPTPPIKARLLADMHELRDPDSYPDPTPTPAQRKRKWRRR